jgi:hypothetical protein
VRDGRSVRKRREERQRVSEREREREERERRRESWCLYLSTLKSIDGKPVRKFLSQSCTDSSSAAIQQNRGKVRRGNIAGKV